MTIDTSEKGLETLIFRHLTGEDGLTPHLAGIVADPGIPPKGSGWFVGAPGSYDRARALDVGQLFAFLLATQEETFNKVGLGDYRDDKNINRLKFLDRISAEIGKRGIIDVLRRGVKHGPLSFDLFYGTPSAGNDKAKALFAKNRFSVTRQLRYSQDETRRALDLCLFINGLPVATFELKNSLTRQNVEDAIEQYKRDRDPKERLFEFGRCMVHLAVDDHEVRMCTHLRGKDSWFLPLNLGHDDGAGNPPNPNGLKTDYLWKRILAPASVTDIIENYAQIVEEKNPKTGKITRTQIFPRYHQLDVVRTLLADAAAHGVGKRYLIQHSAGSGKSNSIAWLAHQLIHLRRPGEDKTVFDSVLVITDRRNLDKQIEETIKQFAQVKSTIGHARNSGDLRRFIEEGKKLIISTVQKFPHILDEIGDEHRGRSFAILIDEAHSSQSGKSAGALNTALGDPEDTVNEALAKRAKDRKMVTNASYFAFTATPKNKTLETFGLPKPPDAEGKVEFRPYHVYTMKQAIQEGFILDVLRYYTPVDSYYRLVKTVSDDPEFDTKKAGKKLRQYVEGHEQAIRRKAEIMIDHFHDQVIAKGKVGGKARAMVVCGGIELAIHYFLAFKAYLAARKSPWQAIVAFSGEKEYMGRNETEASLNGFPSADIEDRIQEDPYRFLICADKFQTGYDEPLLHTMYVDKVLEGIKAVQTLSRLNRARHGKADVFVLDFMNDIKTIEDAFSTFYRSTRLSDQTDPNNLHDLKAELDQAQVYSPDQVDGFVEKFLAGADREQLDAILDVCAVTYEGLDEDAQVKFKGSAKSFVRTYDFLSTLLSYVNTDWEKLSIFLTLLVKKLPSPQGPDLSAGILESIDMDSYRAEKKQTLAIQPVDEDAKVDPVPVGSGGKAQDPEMQRLSLILEKFNQRFGTLFQDGDRILRMIREDIVPKVASDEPYQNALRNTPAAAAIELNAAMMRAIAPLLKDNTEFYKQFVQNPEFKTFVTAMVESLAGRPPAA